MKIVSIFRQSEAGWLMERLPRHGFLHPAMSARIAAASWWYSVVRLGSSPKKAVISATV